MVREEEGKLPEGTSGSVIAAYICECGPLNRGGRERERERVHLRTVDWQADEFDWRDALRTELGWVKLG